MNDDEKLLDHQDWKTIIITTKDKKLNDKNNSVSVKKNNNQNIDLKLEKKVEDGELKHTMFTKEFTKALIKKRTELKMTQKQMANSLNISVQILSDIERNVAKYDSKLNNKIKRIYKI